MSNKANAENNKSAETKNTTDSHLIGPRQEYRRTGNAPDDSDAFASGKGGEGKPSTPFRY
jgi:hypothetical protein